MGFSPQAALELVDASGRRYSILDFAGNRFLTESGLLSELAAWLSLVPHSILVVQVTTVYVTRDYHQGLYFLGTLLNALVTMVLKRLIRDPRPLGEYSQCVALETCGEYGLPSSHTSLAFFAATLVYMNNKAVLSTKEKKKKNIDLYYLWGLAESVVCMVVATLVGVSRVHLQYHTITQVLCGALQGLVAGSVWWQVCQAVTDRRKRRPEPIVRD